MKTIYLIRHGQTNWNLQGKMQGHSNIELNEIGREQANALQLFFLENPVDKVFSSDLKRAYETAQIATEPLQLDVLKVEGLREVHLGQVEGKTEDEIIAAHGAESWRQWRTWDGSANFAYPLGKTHLESITRGLRSLENLFREFEFTKAAVCSHGLLIRRLGHFLRPEWTEALPTPNCGVFKILWQDEKLVFKGLVHRP